MRRYFLTAFPSFFSFFFFSCCSLAAATAGAIDACLSHGLKRRALGLFKTNSTTALIQKVSKNCEPAAQLYRVVQEIESSENNV